MATPIRFPMLGENFQITIEPSFQLFGITIHWYGVIIAVGFLLAVLYAVKRSKQFGLTEENIIDLLIFSVPLAIIGARLYYVIFSWDDYKDNLVDVFKIWNGGLAIYGGVIGAVIGLLIFSKVKKVKLGAAADVGGLGLLIGQAIGRWGNFVNQEAFGEQTTIFCRMGLMRYIADAKEYRVFYYHPCFLYESLWNALGLLILHFYSKKRKFDGEIFLLYLVWYGIGRALIEGLRTDSLYFFGSNLRVSQVLAILCVIVGLGAILYVRVAKNPEPEDLWVNRGQKAAAVPEAAPVPEPEENDYDEDFSSALELLKHGTSLDDEEETVEEGPVVEPVDVPDAADGEKPQDE